MTKIVQEVEVQIRHHDVPLALLLREVAEDLNIYNFESAVQHKKSWFIKVWDWLKGGKKKEVRQSTETILGLVSLEGEVIGNLPGDWRVCDDYRINAPEFSGLVRILGEGRFKNQGAYCCPRLEAGRQKL